METTLAQKLVTYQPKPSTIELIKRTPILLLVGPTGSGKSALEEKLLASGDYHLIVSHTTRQPRPNHGVPEQDGQEYHFIDSAQAELLLDQQAFVEAKVFSGNLYGTSVAEIQAAYDAGLTALANIEVKGVAEYKAIDPKVMAVFLLPPDFKTWQNRLSHRAGGVTNSVDMRRRMETALDEFDQLLNTDYYIAVLNTGLDVTVDEVQNIVRTRKHDPAAEAHARDIARQLAQETRAYLATQKL